MVENKALYVVKENSHYLILKISSEDLEIDLNSKDSKVLKDIFNKLIVELKNGLFKFIYEKDGNNLYESVCEEYISQLNKEIESVYRELEDNKLIKL